MWGASQADPFETPGGEVLFSWTATRIFQYSEDCCVVSFLLPRATLHLAALKGPVFSLSTWHIFSFPDLHLYQGRDQLFGRQHLAGDAPHNLMRTFCTRRGMSKLRPASQLWPACRLSLKTHSLWQPHSFQSNKLHWHLFTLRGQHFSAASEMEQEAFLEKPLQKHIANWHSFLVENFPICMLLVTLTIMSLSCHDNMLVHMQSGRSRYCSKNLVSKNVFLWSAWHLSYGFKISAALVARGSDLVPVEKHLDNLY